MSWNYSGNPATSDLDEVRFLLQDTDETTPLFEDEEIQYSIARLSSIYGDNLMVAAYLCDVLASSALEERSISADGVSVSGADLTDRFTKMGARFRAMHNEIAGMGGGPIFTADGFQWPDFGERPKVFGLGSTDNRWAGRQNYGNLARWPEAEPDGGYWIPS